MPHIYSHRSKERREFERRRIDKQWVLNEDKREHSTPLQSKKTKQKKKKLRILYLCTLKMKQREVTRASTPFKTRGHSVNYLAATTTNTLLLTVSAPWEVGEGRGGPLGNSLLTTPVRRYGGEVVIYRNLYTSSLISFWMTWYLFIKYIDIDLFFYCWIN